VRAAGTSFFHGTLDAMGFDVRDTGFHMVLDRGVPELVRTTIWPAIERWVRAQGLEPADLDHWLVHPGGRRVLDAVEEGIGRGPAAVRDARAVLAELGNLSSASVLALLERFERLERARAGDLGLLVAFGPGFNAEHLLLEWEA
jgi:alkylresorcinol/alkylpyrone synthase